MGGAAVKPLLHFFILCGPPCYGGTRTDAALSCFMEAKTFGDALISAVNLGGDADTVGACCGALAGANWGMGAIPERWIRDLEGVPKILSLADELAAAAEI